MATKRIPRGWRVLSAFVLALLLAVPALSAFAQDAGAVISIDRPTDGDGFRIGDQVTFSGWAAHRAGPGTGVDRVTVLDAPVGAGGKSVVEAQYGLARTDVGATYGDAWTNSGYQAVWRATGQTGNRTFWVYAHSPSNDGWTNKTVTIRLAEGLARGGGPGGPGGPGQYGQYGPGGPGQGQYGPGSPYGAAPIGGNPFYGGGYGGYGGYPPPYPPYGGGYGGYGGGAYCPGLYNPYGSAYTYGQPYNPGYGNYYAGSALYNGYCPPYPIGQPPYGTGYGISGPLVTATADPTGTIILSWVPIPNATQYRIYELVPSSISQFNLITSQPQNIGGASVTATVSGLPPGSPHTYQVRAVDGTGVETVVPASSTAIGGLLPPAGVTVAARTSNTITLTWGPSPSPGVTSYLVQQGPSPNGPFGPSVVTGTSLSGATVGGLLPNTTYYFSVVGVAAGVQSPPSPPIPATTTP